MSKCKGGEPHEYTVQEREGRMLDFSDVKYEICVRCGNRKRWKKDTQGRVDNTRYLEAHIRNYCQPWGATRKTFIKLYHPQMNKIRICLNPEHEGKECPVFAIDTDYTKKAFRLDNTKGTNVEKVRKEIYGV